MSGYPVRLVVTDDLRRTRLTVFFRLLLAIPHFIWLSLWGIAAAVAAILNWFATLFAGRMPRGMRDLGAFCMRYDQQTAAYVLLLTDRYPPLSSP